MPCKPNYICRTIGLGRGCVQTHLVRFEEQDESHNTGIRGELAGVSRPTGEMRLTFRLLGSCLPYEDTTGRHEASMPGQRITEILRKKPYVRSGSDPVNRSPISRHRDTETSDLLNR